MSIIMCKKCIIIYDKEKQLIVTLEKLKHKNVIVKRCFSCKITIYYQKGGG